MARVSDMGRVEWEDSKDQGSKVVHITEGLEYCKI